MRMAATSLGVAFAVFLMIFQGSLLIGFMKAAGKIVASTDSDLWIAPRGVVCFDFATTMDARFREIARGIAGVESVSRVSVSFVDYRIPDGEQRIVVLVGADPQVGQRFPIPYFPGSQDALEPEAILVDQTSAKDLGIQNIPSEVEINGLRAHVSGIASGFSSFLGSPYAFSSYADAARYAKTNNQVSYITVRVAKGYDVASVKSKLATELPEVNVWTRDEFERRSQLYWVGQTGAGAAILTAAVLAFLIGLVLVSQTVYATTLERLEEFATLKALGASRRFIVNVVLTQALAFGVAGGLVGVFSAVPMVQIAKRAVAWIYMPSWLVAGVLLPAFAMCMLASILSIRAALSVEPARVFRA